MTYNDFVKGVDLKVLTYPSTWRKGQSVFNAVDELYGIARTVQFVDHVDCFYNDSKIDEFLKCCYNRLKV